MPPTKIVLVTGPRVEGALAGASKRAKVYWLGELSEAELDALLPRVECVLVRGWWPESLTPERLSRMVRLGFVQSGMAGVNHIPFRRLPKSTVVSSNAGGFSTGVAEHAIALLLAAAKRVVSLDRSMRTGDFDRRTVGRIYGELVQLRGRTAGVLGYGGIGRAVGSMAAGIGMKVTAFSRHPGRDGSVTVLSGRRGLLSVLRASDAAVVALPLSRSTAGLVGTAELRAMKENAILVNVARAEIVDEGAVYRHLLDHPGFTYATDVWAIKDGKETYSSRFPLLKLPNFIGTPHVAGGSVSATGEPTKMAVENLLRYLKGLPPRNVVDASEYA